MKISYYSFISLTDYSFSLNSTFIFPAFRSTMVSSGPQLCAGVRMCIHCLVAARDKRNAPPTNCERLHFLFPVTMRASYFKNMMRLMHEKKTFKNVMLNNT